EMYVSGNLYGSRTGPDVYSLGG
ncbi:MAG: hypothetical protein K0R55_4476, partial [Sporomusa sp.]|nr:hypothetical protein [Sporomusa sp.]